MAESSALAEDRSAGKSPRISCVHRAGWVMTDPATVLPNGYLAVENGVVVSVGSGRVPGDAPVVDHGHGVLMPAMINAHTHLELSALNGMIPMDMGFRQWVMQVLSTRRQLGTEALLAGVDQGIEQLLASGSAVIGEISTLGISAGPFAASGLSGVWFREYLGSDPAEDLKAVRLNGNLPVSLAGHAPHTTAPDLLRRLKSAAAAMDRPFSIHLAESDDEMEFVKTASGEWSDFLDRRGIDYAAWGLPAASPVAHLDRLGLLDEATVAVHLVQATAKEMDILAQRGVNVCLCPRSNYNLYKRLPDVAAMQAAGLSLCLGTDSLASVGSLSMFDEMAFTARRFPFLSPADILAWATLNGALALGLGDRYGSLAPGKRAAFIYVPVSAAGPRDLREHLVNGMVGEKPIKLIR